MSRLAVFDLDGTLVDTAPDLAESLNHCLVADGLAPIDLDRVRPHAGHGARSMLRAAYAHHGQAPSKEEIEAHLPRFLAFYEANIAVASRPFPHVIEAMDALAKEGWTLAICTNKMEKLAVRLLDALDLSDRFAAICGADTFPAMKPDPAHLLGTIARARSDVSRTVMIGDTMTDIRAARNAGTPSILVDFGYVPDAEAKANATVVIDSYKRLTPDLAAGLLKTG